MTPVPFISPISYEIKSSASGKIPAGQLTRLKQIQGRDIKKIWTRLKWKQSTNTLVENSRFKRTFDALSSLGVKKLAPVATTVTAVVAFASVDDAFAEFEAELLALKGLSDPVDIALQRGVVVQKLKSLIDAVSGGFAEDASNALLLIYIYRVMLPRLNEPHWQPESPPPIEQSSIQVLDAMGPCCTIAIAIASVMPMSDQSEHAPLTADQQAAIEQIEALGGTVFQVLGTSQQVVESISFRGPRFADAQLSLLEPFRGYDLYSLAIVDARVSEDGACRAIRQFPELKGFTAMNVPLGDGVPQVLSKATKLLNVDLGGTRVTSDGVQHLAGLTNLTMLSLSETIVDDEGLKHLENLTELWWLSLGNTQITDAGLEFIAKLKNLDTLLLNGTGLTDEGLKWLAPLKKLDSLRLDGTKITDAGLAHLKQFPKLQYLTLDDTAITDEGLKHLQNMPKLDDISMSGTQVTRPGGDRFMLYLPANEKRFRKQREQFERGDWPPDESE